jgi:hypothetical protein
MRILLTIDGCINRSSSAHDASRAGIRSSSMG